MGWRLLLCLGRRLAPGLAPGDPLPLAARSERVDRDRSLRVDRNPTRSCMPSTKPSMKGVTAAGSAANLCAVARASRKRRAARAARAVLGPEPEPLAISSNSRSKWWVYRHRLDLAHVVLPGRREGFSMARQSAGRRSGSARGRRAPWDSTFSTRSGTSPPFGPCAGCAR